MTREIISIQIGKCGINIGNDFWKEMLFELDLDPTGKILGIKKESDYSKNIFFNEYPNSMYKPRAILFDLESNAIASTKKSTYDFFYTNKNIIMGEKTSGNNWVTGYNQAFEYKDQIDEIIRKNAEKCEKLGGFNFFHSMSGGTGSGSCSFILELLDEEFKKKFKNFYTVIPDQKHTSDIVVQPYNSILAMRWLILYADCVTFFENSCIEKIINQGFEDEKIYLKHINFIIAKILNHSMLSITSPYSLNPGIENFLASMIPLPNFHFLFTGINDACIPGKTMDKREMFKYMTERKYNFCVDIDIKKGNLLSSTQFIRENNKKINHFPFNNILDNRNARFIDWSPVSSHNRIFRKSKNKKDQLQNFCFINSSCIKNLFKNTLVKYEVLKKRNAFINNFLIEFNSADGLELFEDANENVAKLIDDYNEIEKS